MRDASESEITASTLRTVRRFNETFDRHDVDAVMALMTEDCVFESTYPPPDGKRYEGQRSVRAFWEDFFRASPHALLETEEMFAAQDRCVVRWRYRWFSEDGESGYIRGVDLFRVRNDRVAEKLSYVKG